MAAGKGVMAAVVICPLTTQSRLNYRKSVAFYFFLKKAKKKSKNSMK